MAKNQAVQPTGTVAGHQIQMIDPALLMPGQNIRTKLRDYRVEALMDSILRIGEVHTPLHVGKLETPQNGYQYVIHQGHYRREAALRLNNEKNAGVMVPCIVEDQEGKERLINQISENLDRENLSPIEKALAMKAMLDEGYTKAEVRHVFQAPGGRKGLKIQDLSNSMLNIHLSFLELPKAVQDRIDDGRISVTGAMALVDVRRKSPDKFDEVVADLEATRIAQIDAEEKAEEKLLAEEKKVNEAEGKAAEISKEAESKRLEAEAASEIAKQKVEAAAAAFTAKRGNLDAAAKKKAEEAFKAADAEANVAQAKADKLAKELTALSAKADKAKQAATEAALKLRQSRELKASKAASKKAVGKEDVAKSAAKSNVSGATVALNLVDFKAAIADIEKSSNPSVKEVGKIMRMVQSGELTTRQAINALAKLFAEGAPETAPATPAKGKK